MCGLDGATNRSHFVPFVKEGVLSVFEVFIETFLTDFVGESLVECDFLVGEILGFKVVIDVVVVLGVEIVEEFGVLQVAFVARVLTHAFQDVLIQSYPMHL